jgi:hypothetical protein
LTTGDQALTEMIQFRGSPLSLADRITEGLDLDKMNTLAEECNSGQLSINDLATELVIMMLNNALKNKCTERQMRAELAQLHFKNDIGMADMIEKKGKLAFNRAIANVVAKTVSSVATIAIEETANYIANRKRSEAAQNTRQGAPIGDSNKDFKYTKPERDAIIHRGQLVAKLTEQMVQATGETINAKLDLETSELDAKMKAKEAMNKLMDSIANSVESSIRAQDQAIQSAMGMLDKINSLAHDSVSRIIGNMR